ncbi:MAG: tRNA adenosine(34) deaminase TadA, partial [Clostridiales Family XIII bacterium]|nr:tRNA adenosine(34) deaminase TadA [Clostridiales Family XIII bacterium]
MSTRDRIIHESFMKEAISEAARAAALGDVPIGAVIVKDGEVIGRGYNRTEVDRDPTMHAEMIAIRDAAKHLGGSRLTGCSLYVTVEPCAMCAGACVLARLDAVYAGTDSPKSGAAGSVKDILTSKELNHTLVYETGILKEECAVILKTFFTSLRT